MRHGYTMISDIDHILINALREDIGNDDVTTSSLISESSSSRAAIRAKGDFVLAGLPYTQRVFALMDGGSRFSGFKKDGDRVRQGQILAKVRGNTRGLLMAERTALNVLQRLSGIATLTDHYVRRIRGTGVRIADTRKTAPGLRVLEKYAVRVGGGHNHRYGLFDGILIKDNHIAVVGSVGRAVKAAGERNHHLLKVEVEVTTLSEVKEALTSGADVIMLDNMPVDKMGKAVKIIRKKDRKTVIEASGDIDLDNVRDVALTGVDIISVGALTHSAPAADISLKFD
jgi:nicotinate-nucleotide pyrophosphorylase (carboxylating)